MVINTGNNERQGGILFKGRWPRKIALVTRSNQREVVTESGSMEVLFSVFSTGDMEKQRQDRLARIFIEYDDDKFTAWLKNVTVKFISRTLSAEWLKTTEIVQKVESECDMDIKAVLRVPETGESTPFFPILDDDVTPVAIVFNSL